MGRPIEYNSVYNLYDYEQPLNSEAYLDDLLTCAEVYKADVMAKIFCMKIYGHDNPREIVADEKDELFHRFVDLLDPVVSLAICEARFRQ